MGDKSDRTRWKITDSWRVGVVLAPNPGPMTLEGTNTWLVRAAAGPAVLVVDPGPDDTDHVQAVLDTVAGARGVVSDVVLTHGHPDHSGALARLVELTDAVVWDARADASPPSGRFDDVAALPAPGHTADSVALHLPFARALCTGDTVLGRGSSVVAAPDGDLGAHLDSLRRLAEFVRAADVRTVLPGHGPVREDAAALIAERLRHRLERLEQVRAALDAGAADLDALLRAVHPGLDAGLHAAARASLRAQWDHLAAEGRASGLEPHVSPQSASEDEGTEAPTPR